MGGKITGTEMLERDSQHVQAHQLSLKFLMYKVTWDIVVIDLIKINLDNSNSNKRLANIFWI